MFKHEKQLFHDFGTTQAFQMYFSMSNPGPNAFATGETHAPAFQ